MILDNTKEKRNQEVCSGNGRTYVFSGTVGNVEAFEINTSKDPNQFYFDLSENKLPAGLIKTLLICTIYKIDGIEIDQTIAKEEVEKFIDDFGLQECAALCLHILTHSIVGNVKKKSINNTKAAKSLKMKFRLSISSYIRKIGWLWVTLLVISMIAAFMTYSFT